MVVRRRENIAGGGKGESDGVRDWISRKDSYLRFLSPRTVREVGVHTGSEGSGDEEGRDGGGVRERFEGGCE